MPCAATQHVSSVAHVNIRVSSKGELVRSQILRPRLSNFIERHTRRYAWRHVRKRCLCARCDPVLRDGIKKYMTVGREGTKHRRVNIISITGGAEEWLVNRVCDDHWII